MVKGRRFRAAASHRLASQIAGLWVVRAAITSPQTQRSHRHVNNHYRHLQQVQAPGLWPACKRIDDMMQATRWQQHSVRGFLAGTVKKKLGFALTSSKLSGADRRYRIETRRGR